MTWTVFEHQYGDNPTGSDAPGRGGYSYVLVEQPAMLAVQWFESEYGQDPTERIAPNPHDDPGWTEKPWNVSQHEDPESAREACGTIDAERGAIGVEQTRRYTWPELNSRLDVRVVSDDEL